MEMVRQKKGLILGILLIVVLGSVFFMYQNSHIRMTMNDDVVTLNDKDKEELKSELSVIIQRLMDGQWDKKLTVDNMDESKNAIIGSWSAKDVWSWVAWRLPNEGWNVLVSFDGYDCRDIEKVPPQYYEFFKNSFETPEGGMYCY